MDKNETPRKSRSGMRKIYEKTEKTSVTAAPLQMLNEDTYLISFSR